MYTAFYKLRDLPFQLGPDPRFFFGSSGHQRAMSYLTYGLSQGEGFIIITGDIGAGKTTLVGHLFDTLDRTKFIAAKVVTTQLDADDVLRMVAGAFRLKIEGTDKATLLRRLEEFFIATYRAGRRSLLVIDEAQNLTVPALEELRMLSNFQSNQRTLLQTFLLGQPQFRTTLGSTDLEQLRQRVIASYHLGPLDADETRAYIEHRLHTVGWQEDPSFSADVFPLIHELTGGVPRKINTLCSRLLLYGYLEESHAIDAAVVERVAAELAAEMPPAAPEPVAARPPRREETADPTPPVARPHKNASPPAAHRKSNGHAGADAAAAESEAEARAEELARLADRIEALEGEVRRHGRSLAQVFGMASDYAGRSRK